MAYANGALQTSPMRVHLLPTDGYRSYFLAGDSPASGTLVDDGGELSGTAAGAGMADGEPLLLTPGRASELLVLMEDGDGTLAVRRGNMTLAATYRPRPAFDLTALPVTGHWTLGVAMGTLSNTNAFR